MDARQPSGRSRSHRPPRRRTPSRFWQPPVKRRKFTAWSEARMKRDDDMKKHIRNTTKGLG